MPGATTARLVVCDCEMPMKAFMIPHTVPKRPTKGAVEPIVARSPVPAGHAATCQRLDARQARSHALLEAGAIGVIECGLGELDFLPRGLDENAHDPASAGQSSACLV
jgi:hypothetical protein